MQRVAVEHHDRGTRQQRRDESVPHHPRRRREPHQAVAGTEVPAQGVVLEVLEEDPPMAVDDRFGQPGGPRREQHTQRMVERHLLELGCAVAGGQLVPGDEVGAERGPVEIVASVCHIDDMADRWQGGRDVGDVAAAVDVGVPVPIPTDGEEHRWLDLSEAVDDAALAELGSAGRPRRAETRTGEEGSEGLGDVRQVTHDAVAASHSDALQAGSRPAHERGQLAERQRDRRARLGTGDDGDRVVWEATADDVLGVVEQRATEPRAARHRSRGQHLGRCRRRDDLEVVPQRLPEVLELGHRPRLQLVVVVEGESPRRAQPVQVATEPARRPRVGTWRPQQGRRTCGGRRHRSGDSIRPRPPVVAVSLTRDEQ